MAFDVEQIFGAIDVILNQRLQDVSFDKTIICTIVDDSDKKNGHYIVTDGTIKFDAYTSDASYRNDEQVRVSVLNGDLTEKKFISGKYVADEDSQPITYTPPLEGIVPITGNLVSNGNNVFSIRANGDTVEKVIWSMSLDDDSFRDLQSNGIYNTITLKADFKTLLSHYNLKSGNYGLRLDLLIQPTLGSSQRIRKYVALDSSEMFGNPYTFSVYSPQAKKIDIVSTGIICEMVLWLYQSITPDGEGARFINKSDQEIPVNKFTDDILVKDIELGFGSNITTIADNTVEIFTTDSPNYLYENHNDESNLKHIELLWYNKTENNEYIGFNDGLYDLDYDEIEYLKVSHQDSRLVAQVGREGVPTDKKGLTLAADIQEAKPLMANARTALTADLKTILQGLRRQVATVNTFKDGLDAILNTTESGILVKAHNDALDAATGLIDSYKGVLQYAYKNQNEINPRDEWNDDWKTNYYNNFTNAFNIAFTQVRQFLSSMELQTRADAEFSGYRGIYDTYNTRTEREIAAIQEILRQIDNLLKDNHNDLISYKNQNKFIEYVRKDFSEYNNKYCIYWYRYERGYKLEYDAAEGANNDEYEFGRFMTDNWRRLTVEDGVLQNLGVPRGDESSEVKDGKTYYIKKPLNQQLIRYMENCTQEEKYIAIVFQNHEMYKSNILTFTNSEDVPDEYLIDQKDALRIEHDVQSFEHYQSYDITNMLVNSADAGKYRQLKCYYEGLFSKDEALIDAGLYWYIPNTSTMITFDKDDLIKKGFATDADLPEKQRTDKSRPGFTYFYKKVGSQEKIILDDEGKEQTVLTCKNEDRDFFYKIKPYYEQAASKNTIEVWAYLPNVAEPIKGDISMTFSTFGTNGTRYTLAITPATSQIAVVGAPYEKIELSQEDFEANKYYYLNNNNEYVLATSWNDDEDYFIKNQLELDVSLRDASNKKIPMTDAAYVEDASIAYNFKTNWKGPTTYIAEYQDVNSDSYIDKILINRDTQYDENQYFFGILQASVSFKYDDAKEMAEKEQNNKAEIDQYQKYRVLDLNALYAIPYSSSGLYYISGPTSIVYNNQGTVSHMSEDPFCLYTVNDKTNAAVSDQNWTIEYYDKDGNWINERHKDWYVMQNYMPVLNSANGLTAAPLYLDGLEDSYYPVAICTVKGNILWVQPIIITQNRYASSTLNDWNGSLTIDEKNGTILSTMVGAGKKENDNSFSGVLMGDVGVGANVDLDELGNFSGLGLYGFNHGAQSFGLNIEGRAFFGKPGRGRIYINGDEGTISSASFQQNREKELDGTWSTKNGTAGMIIDLDDGSIHMSGTTQDEYSGAYSGEVQIDENDDTKTAQAQVRIDVKSPYFKIRSANQFNPEHYLIYIANDKYYLQTDDFNAWNFTASDGSGELDFSGKGMRIDLKDGRIDAYNFRLSSKNVLINSADNSDAFFVIKDNKGSNLLYASPNDYYLKSSDFDGVSEGTKISLKEGAIESYKFSLRAGSDGSGGYQIIMTSDGMDEDNAYLKIATASGAKLICITENNQYMQSYNYNFANETGFKIDLTNGKIDAFSFNLTAGTGDNKIIITSDTSATYPLQIDKNFKVDWAGQLEASNGKFTGEIHATSGTFKGDIESEAVIKGGTFVGAEIYIPTKEDPKFFVTGEGRLEATSANIGGWEVTAPDSGFLTDTFKIAPDGLNFNDVLTVDSDGTTIIDDLDVVNSFEVLSARGKDPVISIDNQGNIKIAGNGRLKFCDDDNYIYYSGTQLYLYSSEWLLLSAPKIGIAGTVGIGQTGAILAEGNPYSLRVGGDILYAGDIYCTNLDQKGQDVTVTVTSGGLFNGKKQILKFAKGILIGTGNDDDSTEDDEDYTIPKLAGNANKFLSNNGSELMWSYVKKKFEVTMTGQVSDVYSRDEGEECFTGVQTREINIYNSQGDYVRTAQEYIGTTGRRTRYNTTKVTRITLVGTSKEITLDASTEDESPIPITITGAEEPT